VRWIELQGLLEAVQTHQFEISTWQKEVWLCDCQLEIDANAWQKQECYSGYCLTTHWFIHITACEGLVSSPSMGLGKRGYSFPKNRLTACRELESWHLEGQVVSNCLYTNPLHRTNQFMISIFSPQAICTGYPNLTRRTGLGNPRRLLLPMTANKPN